MRIALAITLSAEQRRQLGTWARSRRAPLRLAERARMILLAAEGRPNGEIARTVGRSRQAVARWRRRFSGHGLAGIEKDAPRPGRKPHISAARVEEIVRKTTQETPPQATHWSTRAMARAAGVSEATMIHDYKRNGTTTPFAALNTLNGRVVGICMSRHTHREWLKFLKLLDEKTPARKPLHVIVDNYAMHKHHAVIRWLKRHPRFHLHFTPTGASWLNMIERFFRDLSSQRIRRGSFASVHELNAAIESDIAQHNHKPKPFIWTAKASDILEKVKRARAALNKLRSV